MYVGADIDTDVAVLLAQTGHRVAFFHIGNPTLDAFCDDEFVRRRDRLGRAVIGADIAFGANVLDAEMQRFIQCQRHGGGDEARAETRTDLGVDQTAVLA